MNRIVWILFVCPLSGAASLHCNAQTPVNLRSTLSIGSTLPNISLSGKSISVQQSIGQSSVIGLFQSENYWLRQGFIQPIAANTKTESDYSLSATISPNPFLDMVKVSIMDAIPDYLFVSLSDIFGRIIYSNKFEPQQQLDLNLSDFLPGIYIIKITSGSKCLTEKLIKE